MYKLLLIISLFIFLDSCKTNKVKNGSLINLSSKNISEISGDYQNTSIDSSFIKLNNCLFLKDDVDSNFKEKKIKILVLDSVTMEVSLFVDNKRKSMTLLKGEIINNYFVVKTKRSIPFFTFFLNVLTIQKTKIGLNSKNNLIINYSNNGFILLIFFPLRGGGYNNVIIEYR